MSWPVELKVFMWEHSTLVTGQESFNWARLPSHINTLMFLQRKLKWVPISVLTWLAHLYKEKQGWEGEKIGQEVGYLRGWELGEIEENIAPLHNIFCRREPLQKEGGTLECKIQEKGCSGLLPLPQLRWHVEHSQHGPTKSGCRGWSYWQGDGEQRYR